MPAIKPLIGETFLGRTVLKDLPIEKGKPRKVVCQCGICGRVRVVRADAIKINSCTCTIRRVGRRDLSPHPNPKIGLTHYKHGRYKTPEYRAWSPLTGAHPYLPNDKGMLEIEAFHLVPNLSATDTVPKIPCKINS